MSGRVLVKICGITSPEDARMAAAAGADAIGVNLWPGSKRYVTDGRAKEILAAVPKGVMKVGVFVNLPPLEVRAKRIDLGLDRAQLHGDERAEDFARLDPSPLIRVVRVSDEASFTEADGWKTPILMYDAHVAGYGGAGVTAPWALIAKHARRPFWLAGGLTPENVRAAITATSPDGVDVASGVERAPGVKDELKVRLFVAAAKAGKL
ncbi:MAG TPA: phosphoribosylanthranilate isomerase [Polyangia bacterium]|nr:phosphoribosylanthranilate isomerase [Polyangia bacterium]